MAAWEKSALARRRPLLGACKCHIGPEDTSGCFGSHAEFGEGRVVSDYYEVCFEAILDQKQLAFTYRDRRREVCPHVLGLTKGKEMLLGYQFAGETSGGLPPRGEWRCFQVAEMHSIETRDGEWHTGGSHSQTHSCVAEVDLDVNPSAPQRSWARHRRKP